MTDLATLPAPPVPADTDLRDLPSMLLDVVRLRDSDLAHHPSAEVFRAAVLTWATSWHQVPAGSLPDDDRKLAHLLGFGRDLRRWQRVRAAGGLHGWTLHSDGRLYHKVVTEKVRDAIAARSKHSSRTTAAREAITAKRAREAQATENTQTALSVTAAVTEAVTDTKVSEGKVSIEREDSSLRSAIATPGTQTALILPLLGGSTAAPDESVGDRVRREAGGNSRRILAVLMPSLTPDKAGELLGAWCKHLRGDRVMLMHVLQTAESDAARERIMGDPKQWLWGCVRKRAADLQTPGGQNGHQSQRLTGTGGDDAMLRGALKAFPELAGGMEGD